MNSPSFNGKFFGFFTRPPSADIIVSGFSLRKSTMALVYSSLFIFLSVVGVFGVAGAFLETGVVIFCFFAEEPFGVFLAELGQFGVVQGG